MAEQLSHWPKKEGVVDWSRYRDGGIWEFNWEEIGGSYHNEWERRAFIDKARAYGKRQRPRLRVQSRMTDLGVAIEFHKARGTDEA